MRDLCQVCKNFSVCPQGEGSEIKPHARVAELINDKGEHSGYFEVVECNLFKEYPG